MRGLSGMTFFVEATIEDVVPIFRFPGQNRRHPPIPQRAPPLLVTATGTLSGTGIVNGNVVMQGTMAPGDSPGTFTINGNYSQDAGGTLDILLGGTAAGQFSVLAVSGLASLDGAVDFTPINGFTPVAGDDFTFLLFGVNSGDFSNIVLTNWVCPLRDTCRAVVAPATLLARA